MRFKRLSLIFLAFYFTFLGGSTYYVLFFPVRVVHHVLVTLLLAVWLTGRIRSRRWLPDTGLNLPVYAPVIFWLLASFAGIDPRVSLERTWFLLLHVAMFFVAADMIQRGYQRLVMEAVFFMAFGVMLLSGVELASWYFGLGYLPGTETGWITTGRLPGLTDFPQLRLAMSISTLLAGYTAPLVTVCGAWALTARGRDYRVVLWGMTAVLALILLLTSSRGGALSLMAALGTLVLIRLLQSPRLRAVVSPRVILGTGITLAAAALVGFVWLTLPASAAGSDAGRLDMWQGAVKLAGTHPLTGMGVGMFGRGFREIRDIFIAQDKLVSAHNIYLNTLAETGIIGTGIAVALMIVFLRLAWQHWKNTPSPGYRFRIEACFAALVGVAVHSLVDVFSITPIALLVVTLAAYVITPQPASRLDPVKPGHRLPAVVGLIIIIAYGIAFIQFDRAQAVYMQSFDTDSPDVSLQKLREALEIDPYLRLYTLHEAYLLGLTEDTEAAAAAYKAALALEPTWDTGWMNLAALAEKSGDINGALVYLEEAAQISALNGATVHLARLAEQTGSLPDDVIVSYYVQGMVVRIQTMLPLADFWHQTPLRIKALEEFTSLDFVSPQVRYRIWAVHDPAQAAALVSDSPVTADEWWIAGEHALRVENDPQKAVEEFTKAIAAAPHVGDYYVSRARALFSLDKSAALDDLNQARLRTVLYEVPNALRAQLVSDPDKAFDLKLNALPIRAVPQEFAAVLYDRPAVFDVYPPMRFPGYSDEQLQPWFELARDFLAEGNTDSARRVFQLIYEHEPYNQTVQEELQRLSQTPAQ